MKKMVLVAIIMLVIVVIAFYYVFFHVGPTSTEQACTNAGGTVRTLLCCLATEDFPNMCLVGPCGCSPENSHEVKICDCGEGKCFDGNTCVAME